MSWNKMHEDCVVVKNIVRDDDSQQVSRNHRRWRLLGAVVIISISILSCNLVTADRTAFSCDNPCPADYTLYVRLRKRDIPGTNATFVARGFCPEDQSKCSLLGPTMTVRPGQHLRIRVQNELNQTETAKVGPRVPVAPDDWISLMDNTTGRYAGLQNCGFVFTGDPDKPKILAHDDLPHHFDTTNLHLHGLTVEPHLFHPQKTSNPAARMIDIRPGECYCYDFNVHEDQPPGSYWYHTHLHGSTAVQTWSGMAGLLRVEGGLDHELPKYNITREEDFVIWDPHVAPLDIKEAKDIRPRNSWDALSGGGGRDRARARASAETERRQLVTAKRAVVGTDFFLLGQTDQSKLWYLVNGENKPTYNMTAGETVRFRVLCATAENLCGFRLEDGESKEIPFWVVASDGISFKSPKLKKGLVLGGGMREDVLIRFAHVGRYSAISDGLSKLQFYCTGPNDATLAFFDVSPSPIPLPTPSFRDFRFTYGIRRPIHNVDVTRTRVLSFALQANRQFAPFPQFLVNGGMYNMSEITFSVRGGEAEEWIVTNPDVTMHPFHSHVAPFLVKELKSALEPPGSDPRLDQMLDVKDTYRDTVVVPAKGFVKLWIRFPAEAAYRGKTVVHCHFLAHEDTGMIANIMIS